MNQKSYHFIHFYGCSLLPLYVGLTICQIVGLCALTVQQPGAPSHFSAPPVHTVPAAAPGVATLFYPAPTPGTPSYFPMLYSPTLATGKSRSKSEKYSFHYHSMEKLFLIFTINSKLESPPAKHLNKVLLS